MSSLWVLLVRKLPLFFHQYLFFPTTELLASLGVSLFQKRAFFNKFSFLLIIGLFPSYTHTLLNLCVQVEIQIQSFFK